MSHSNMHWTRQLASLLVVLIAGLALGVGWSKWRAGHHAAGGGASPASAVPAANPERRVLYWHDPMRPELRFDKPGKSPFMDMPLQPVYADDNANAASGEPDVHVSTAAQQQLGIRLGRVERAAISPVVNAVGIVAYDDAAQAIVQPRVDGYVTRLIIRTALEHVRRGQVLAEVDAPAWREALGEYLALSAGSFAGNSALRAALRQRLVVLGVPNAAILQVEQSRTPPARFELTAPVAGVVTELGLREGAAFTAGTVLARINRIDPVWVDGQLPESQARAVAAGQRVHISTIAYPGQVFTGKVLRVLPALDPVTRTIGVRVAVDNAGGRLSPGMYVEAAFPGRAARPQLWVPSEAVITTGERSVVIVARDGGGFAVANVTTGVEADGKTAILSGLTAGQSVVRSGQFLIDSEADLESAFNRLAAPGASP